MAGGEPEGPGFPTSGLIAALLLVVSAFVVHQQLPYIASRQSGTDLLRRQFVVTQDVEARLWQDPFTAINLHVEQESPSARRVITHDSVAELCGWNTAIKTPRPLVGHGCWSAQPCSMPWACVSCLPSACPVPQRGATSRESSIGSWSRWT